MRGREGTFNGEGQEKLFFRSSFPSGDPKAVIIAVHGLGDHSGGWQSVMERLTEKGYAAYAFDLRGHGRSPGKRGFIGSWEDYRGDLHAFRTLISTEHPDIPLFIVGHSLGSVIGLDYCLHYGAGVAGLIAVAPAVSFEVKRSDKIFIHILGILKPDFAVEQKGNLHHLTRDAGMIHKLQSDSLRHNKITPGLGRGMLKTVTYIKEHADAIQLPLLLQYGLGDEITPPAKLREFFETVGSKDKQKVEYEEAKHRPFDDIEREQFFEDLISWLNRQTGGI